MIFDSIDNFGLMKTKIKVIGVGGAGKNAVDHMIENDVRGVEFYCVNTDAQDLKVSKAPNKLLIGKTTTRGQGAGANPEIGRAAAIESEDDIHAMIGDAQMVFITCGMGGGTGTGAAPIIAKVAREHGCLTVGICTKPFVFEGPSRAANASQGLDNIRPYVDTLIVIPNERLSLVIKPGAPLLEAFREADKILRQGVQSIAETISLPGLINLDFADVTSVMKDKGTALLGIGAATGPHRAIEAARRAIHSPLLEVTIDGATDAIVNITANTSLALDEVTQAVEEIRNNSGKNLNLIFGAAFNSSLGDELIVTVIATGYELKAQSNGFNGIKNVIFNNMSNETLEYEELINENKEVVINDVSRTDSEERISEIFENINPKEKRRREKEEEKRRKEQEKKMKKLGKKNQSFDDLDDDDDQDTIPDWLVK